MIGILVTLAGVIFTVFAAGTDRDRASFSVMGYLFLLVAVLAYALYSVLVEKDKSFSGLELTYVMITAGAVVFSAFAVVEALIDGDMFVLITLPVRNVDFLIAVLYQGIGCSILAFFLSNTAIVKAGVNRTSSFIGLSTVVSILAVVIILKETVTALQIVGAAVILLGVYIANLRESRLNSNI